MSSPVKTCPRCQKSISPEAIACPHCRTPLKALGHAGIPLHQAPTGEFLCDTCLYHQDNSCNYPQRPTAKDCIMYVDLRQPMEEVGNHGTGGDRRSPLNGQLRTWVRRNLAWVVVIVMVIISIWMVLSGG